MFSRTMVILLLAAVGIVVANQTGQIMDRYGPVAYYSAIGVIGVGLAALARPVRRS